MLLLGVMLLLQAPTPSRATADTTVSLSFNWKAGRPAYLLTISEPVRADSSNEQWQWIHLRAPDGTEYTGRSAEGPFVTLADGLVDTALAKDNLAATPWAYLSPRVRGADGSPMLFLFGYAYASDPGSLQALALDASGHPYQVFASQTFDLVDLADLDGDGLAEIIGRPSLSQCSSGCNDCTYDPIAVYHLTRGAKMRAVYSLALSRAYNSAHYVWAGPRMSERIAVDLCDPRKPRLATVAK